MATTSISDFVHGSSKALLELKAQLGRMQACQDAVEALLSRLVVLPQDLLSQVEDFIERNRQLGFETKEQFVSDAVHFRLTWFKEENQCLEISGKQYERLEEAVKEMDAPFRSAEHFINSQIERFLEKYEEYKKQHT